VSRLWRLVEEKTRPPEAGPPQAGKRKRRAPLKAKGAAPMFF